MATKKVGDRYFTGSCYYAYSSVKLVSKDTKNKTVKVTQSLKWAF